METLGNTEPQNPNNGSSRSPTHQAVVRVLVHGKGHAELKHLCTPGAKGFYWGSWIRVRGIEIRVKGLRLS